MTEPRLKSQEINQQFEPGDKLHHYHAALITETLHFP